MPKTPQLQDRYVMTFAGPEAQHLAQIMLTWVGQLADQLAPAKAAQARANG